MIRSRVSDAIMKYLYGRGAFFHPRHRVLPDQVGEGWPWGGMVVLCLAVEELIITV